MAKYNFYYGESQYGTKEVIAVSSYAGRPVRATAKCHPNDEYSEEMGKKLAKARCDQKVAYKRRQRAIRKLEEAREALKIAQRKYNKMVAYFDDATDALEEANDDLLYMESIAEAR